MRPYIQIPLVDMHLPSTVIEYHNKSLITKQKPKKQCELCKITLKLLLLFNDVSAYTVWLIWSVTHFYTICAT